MKLVSRDGRGNAITAGVAKAKADVILISGHTWAARARRRCHRSSIAGTPWEIGLSEANQVLTLNNVCATA